ncbi:MAG: DUF2231 domain-containing protein [Phycisphaerae bacterium]|jgi:uncharacterized membrane protein
MNPLAIPTAPAFDGLHPLVVHFALAIPLIVPVFLVIALAWKSQWRAMLVASLVTCAVGTAFMLLAIQTGEATEKYAHMVEGTGPTLHRHEELAELARNLFIGVTATLTIATIIAFKSGDRIKTSTRLGLLAGCLLVWLLPALVLANAAHAGGELVHVHGVKAPITSAANQAAAFVEQDND